MLCVSSLTYVSSYEKVTLYDASMVPSRLPLTRTFTRTLRGTTEEGSVTLVDPLIDGLPESENTSTPSTVTIAEQEADISLDAAYVKFKLKD